MALEPDPGPEGANSARRGPTLSDLSFSIRARSSQGHFHLDFNSARTGEFRATPGLPLLYAFWGAFPGPAHSGTQQSPSACHLTRLLTVTPDPPWWTA